MSRKGRPKICDICYETSGHIRQYKGWLLCTRCRKSFVRWDEMTPEQRLEEMQYMARYAAREERW